MKPHHTLYFSHFLVWMIGMMLGVALSKSALLWISLIILVALTLGFLGKLTMKPRKKRLRVVRPS